MPPSISDILPRHSYFNTEFPAFSVADSDLRLLGDGRAFLTLRDGNAPGTAVRFVITDPNAEIGYELHPVRGGLSRFGMRSALLVSPEIDQTKDPITAVGLIDESRGISEEMSDWIEENHDSLLGPQLTKRFLPLVSNDDAPIQWEEMISFEAAKQSVFELISATYHFEPTVTKTRSLRVKEKVEYGTVVKHGFDLVESAEGLALIEHHHIHSPRIPIIKVIETNKRGRLIITPVQDKHL